MKTSPISLSQKMVGDVVRLGQTIPYIHGIIDLDITEVRQRLRDHRKSNDLSISMNTLLLKACAIAIHQDMKLVRFLAGNSRIAELEQVDFFTPVETEERGLNTLIIRNTNKKALAELQTRFDKGEGLILNGAQRTFMKLPWGLRKWIYRYWLRRPKLRQAYFGNVYFSSVSNLSNGSAMAGVPIPMHPIGIFIGSVYKQNSKDMIKVTVSIDHRINNGSDIARFIKRLKQALASSELYAHN